LVQKGRGSALVQKVHGPAAGGLVGVEALVEQQVVWQGWYRPSSWWFSRDGIG